MSVEGVVNGFEIVKIKSEKTQEKTLYLRYLKSGNFFTRSCYKDVTDEKIEEIRQLLLDYTKTNLLAEELNGTLTIITIIHEVERIIFDN